MSASALSPETGDIVIPDDLLEYFLTRIVSSGLRSDDFNSKLKENIEKKITLVKNACEDFNSLEETLKLTDLEFNH
jgi:hypothetical protein